MIDRDTWDELDEALTDLKSVIWIEVEKVCLPIIEWLSERLDNQ